MSDLKATLATRADGEVAPRQPTVADLLEQQKAQIARALPQHMNPERFARILLTECRRNPELMQCTPVSLLAAVMTAAQLGLEPGPLQHVYLIPRWNKNVQGKEVSLLIGYRGFIDLARRGGQTLSIDAHVVHANDDFDFSYGLDATLRHIPTSGDRGAPLWVYAVAKFKDGGHSFVVLSMDDVEARKARSQAGDSGPWKTDPEAMMRKTAVRALAPMLPQSIELAQAERLDGAVRTDIDSDLLEFQPPPAIDVGGEETEGAGAPADSAATASEGASSQSDASTAADQDAPAPEGTKDAIAIGTARREVTSYRATKGAGATTAHRKLDEFLNDNGLDMDLENLDGAKAVAVIEYLAKNPIGRKRGDA